MVHHAVHGDPRPKGFVVVALLMVATTLLSCSQRHPTDRGVSEAGLAPCPSSPNCVSSDARDTGHGVDALRLARPAGEAWDEARAVVLNFPRTRIVDEQPTYVRVECRSAFFGFVDDLELQLRPADNIIAVRSASRLGYSDLGVNRRRVERLRAALIERGIVR
jgi:uncharacterized protein (DUF1499 family)